jgi:hypothetical protein
MSAGLAFITFIVLMVVVVISVSVASKLASLSRESGNSSFNELDKQFELIDGSTTVLPTHIK